MRSLPFGLRAAALLAAAALGVHRLRYLVGYGADSGDVLSRHGHGYLWAVLALTVIALCLAGAALAHALRRAGRAGPPSAHRRSSFTAVWVRASTALAVLYAVQESLEGALVPAHGGGLAGVVGNGGWTAFAFAVLLGALVALLLRGADAAIAHAGRRARRSPARHAHRRTRRLPRAARCPVHLLAPSLVPRGPPLPAR